MASPNRLVMVAIGGAMTLAVVLGLGIAISKDVGTLTSAAPADLALALGELHQRAAKGELRLEPPESTEFKLIDAGFPPRKSAPIPAGTGATTLKGGAVTTLGGMKAALAHYESGEGRFTVFTLPDQKEASFPDAGKLIRQGAQLFSTRRGELTVVGWRSGHWVYCVVTAMPDNDRMLLVDKVRAFQAK